MKGPPSDVRFLLVLLALSLSANVLLVRRIWMAGPSAARAPIPSREEFLAALAKQPRQLLPGLVGGTRVTVVKFNDYQCPPCRMAYEQFEPVIARLQAVHPGEIELVVKDFPLESECNPTVRDSPHPAACEAAAAVRLAGPAGKAGELAEWLFEHQRALTPESVWGAARALTGRSYTESDYQSAIAEIKKDVTLGAELRIPGTPTFLINGLLVDPPTPELFEAAIELERSRAGRRADDTAIVRLTR